MELIGTEGLLKSTTSLWATTPCERDCLSATTSCQVPPPYGWPQEMPSPVATNQPTGNDQWGMRFFSRQGLLPVSRDLLPVSIGTSCDLGSLGWQAPCGTDGLSAAWQWPVYGLFSALVNDIRQWGSMGINCQWPVGNEGLLAVFQYEVCYVGMSGLYVGLCLCSFSGAMLAMWGGPFPVYRPVVLPVLGGCVFGRS